MSTLAQAWYQLPASCQSAVTLNPQEGRRGNPGWRDTAGLAFPPSSFLAHPQGHPALWLPRGQNCPSLRSEDAFGQAWTETMLSSAVKPGSGVSSSGDLVPHSQVWSTAVLPVVVTPWELSVKTQVCGAQAFNVCVSIHIMWSHH